MKLSPYAVLIVMLIVIAAGLLLFKTQRHQATVIEIPLSPTMAPTPTITLTPTPRPLTFAEMSALYGPCASVPVLMYHHIQTEEQAVAKKQQSLTVYTPVFTEQMQYLKDHAYVTLWPEELKAYFDEGKPLPKKAVMITIDDGYADNFTDAFGVLRDKGMKATIFVATGLMENPDYLTWNQINEMKNSGMIYFGNHTWSHKSMTSDIPTETKEIQTADGQLMTHGLNAAKIFAYPYGSENNNALATLNTAGYTIAFTTKPGRILCEKQRLLLPRIRMSNRTMQSMGF